MTSDESVSQWIQALKAGDETAVARLLERYFHLLVELARKKLGGAPRRVEDEEDVALSVFDTICHGAAGGKFPELATRNDLWWLLLAVTTHKAAQYRRSASRKKRGAGRVWSETEGIIDTDSLRSFCLDNLQSATPTPEFLTMLHEQHERLMGRLRDTRLREIAVWKMEGYTNDEISRKLAISTRSVERKLRLIRTEWARELNR